MNLEVIKIELLEDYLTLVPKDLAQRFDALKDADISTIRLAFIRQ